MGFGQGQTKLVELKLRSRNKPGIFLALPRLHPKVLGVTRIFGFFLALAPVALAFYPSDRSLAPEVIAFGSCNRSSLPQWHWPEVTGTGADLWIWLGDNYYGDDGDADDLEAKSLSLFHHPAYQSFREQVPVIGTWDDHDYGFNDGDRRNPYKAKARDWLLNFLEEPADSPRRPREGVWEAIRFGTPGRDLEVLLLDTRWAASGPGGDILGQSQWDWLAQHLANPAPTLTLIVSSIQIIPDEHPFETWANYPESRARLLEMLVNCGRPGVIILSGDRHFSEISRLERPGLYPLYEITSSSLTHAWGSLREESNRHRVGDFLNRNNFGLLQINWDTGTLDFSARTAGGGQELPLHLSLTDLAPAP